ncbi:MAG: D-Ala-D-Ala carboxypeptidase family metallohydrolase [bacterium]
MKQPLGVAGTPVWILPFILVAAFLAVQGQAAPFADGRAGFEVRFRNLVIPYEVAAIFVMPGESIELEVVDPEPGAVFTLAANGPVTERGRAKWSWMVPTAPGFEEIRITETASGRVMVLNVGILVPRSKVAGGVLNGYRMGDYPDVPLKGLSIYLPPAGFIEMTPENEYLKVSPHFTLGQFQCKQGGEYPKYIVLRTRLLLKLELILEEVNRRGYPCDTFAILSGYRTPQYNHAIGNVKYSRHVWGGAADIFIDSDPVDGTMDDLNGDGKNTIADAAVLYALIDHLYGEPWYSPFVGGLGQYRKTTAHGPFVHVDVRGFRARWGD